MSELKPHIHEDAVLAIAGNKSDFDQKRPAVFADIGGLETNKHLVGGLRNAGWVIQCGLRAYFHTSHYFR